MNLAQNPPPGLSSLLRILDPGEGGQSIVIPEDLLAQSLDLDRERLVTIHQFLERLLEGEATPNADLKGMLNHLAGRAWGMSFEFGANAKAARRFLEALNVTLAQKLS